MINAAQPKTPPVVYCTECGRAFGSDPAGLCICGPCAVRLEEYERVGMAELERMTQEED